MVTGGRRRAVFLDRDGTLNRAIIRDGKSYPPQTVEQFELFPGVEVTLRALKDAGFLLVVATNQPDVATGQQSRAVVEAIHRELTRRVPIDDVRVCYHVDTDGCDCRKPKPGMLLDAASVLGIELSRSYMIGDRWRDVSAGRAAGCRTIFVRNDYAERQPEQYDAAVASVAEAGQLILSGTV